MTIRTIDAAEITAAVKKLLMDCNYYIGKDIFGSLEAALEIEDSPIAQSVLRQIIENDKIAADEEIPLCQDTGMAVLFVEYGDRVCMANGSFEDAVQQGVREAYTDGYLRKSVVSDPVFDRVNTRDNTPAIIHTKIVSGTSIRITAGGKGFGSENMSAKGLWQRKHVRHQNADACLRRRGRQAVHSRHRPRSRTQSLSADRGRRGHRRHL